MNSNHNFEVSLTILHDVTEHLELHHNVVPATIVQAMGALLATYTASQPDPQKATETFINYFRSAVNTVIANESKEKKAKPSSEF